MSESSNSVRRRHTRSAISYVSSSLHAAQEEIKPHDISVRELLVLDRIRILEQESQHLQAEIKAWKLCLEASKRTRDPVAPGTSE
jgi:hypothetical protein